jgi:adenylosuccinate synthase
MTAGRAGEVKLHTLQINRLEEQTTMMYEEFEKLYGTAVPARVYSKLECLYMQDDSVATKEQFVAKVKRLHLVEKYMMEIIKDQQKKLDKVEELARRWKKEADETMERVQPKVQTARELLVEGSNNYYAYNNYCMSLERTTTLSTIIEIIEE